MNDTAQSADPELRELCETWYRKLDAHAPIEELLPHLTEDGLAMRLPEGTLLGTDAFTLWHEKVIRTFFDEVRTLKELVATPLDGATRMRVVVSWQARIWSPPAPKSQWIGFDVHETWVVERAPGTGRLVIVTYIVDELQPMRGSPSLQDHV